MRWPFLARWRSKAAERADVPPISKAAAAGLSGPCSASGARFTPFLKWCTVLVLPESAKHARRAVQVGAANGVAAAAHEEAARAEFKGHTQCVAALAWPAPGDQLFLSAGEGQQRAGLVAADAGGQVDLSGKECCPCSPVLVCPAASGPLLAGPLLGTGGSRITSSAWRALPAGTLVSGSWDHSVRTWDVETQV